MMSSTGPLRELCRPIVHLFYHRRAGKDITVSTCFVACGSGLRPWTCTSLTGYLTERLQEEHLIIEKIPCAWRERRGKRELAQRIIVQY